MTGLLPILQNLETAVIDKVVHEATASGHSISCRAGCGACCRQLVPVSIFEAEALFQWFSDLQEEQREMIEQRFHQALLALRENGILQRLLDEEWSKDEESVTRLAIDYFHARVACPFLQNENCSIHPIRPLSCREYLVTGPPALCDDPSIHDVRGVKFPFTLSRALYRLGQELEHDNRGWIPMVFLLAWGKSGLHPGEHFTGTGQEVLRIFMEHLATMASTDKGGKTSAGLMQAT
ncbi:YkgJ family cysteine cluster protein [Paracidobacterium acidisoli]|nr:YkgJ family cysteine cluster protein [Paracidobacterium acidisoli]